MFKSIIRFAFVLLLVTTVNAQKSKKHSTDKPKLVVGLVVDQMRWDYLYRYQEKYTQDGFKRMMKEGYSLNNVMIPYIPTITAVGHTSIYTGAVPSIHGIIGNNWIDRETGKSIYCTADDSVLPIGTSNKKAGSQSPKNLLSTSITDQLRLATNFRSKVVGVSLKDRASILPAGHNPTAAFWFDDSTGSFITSSYYMSQLPSWVNDFNNQKYPEKLLENGWDTFFPIKEYVQSTADNVSWEKPVGTAKEPVFPYNNLLEDYKTKKGVIRTTPFGNTLTLQFAKASLENYELGKGSETDFLAINLASTDYIGHSYGPNSIEIEDTYIRLDRDLANFFNYLDNKIGKNQYVVFLSADHGGAHSEEFLRTNKILGGFFDFEMDKKIKDEVEKKFSASDILLGLDNYQIYLNDKVIKEKNLNAKEVKNFVAELVIKEPNILYAFDVKTTATESIPEPIKSRAINGYNWKRSGDVQIVTQDGVLASYAKKGTTHSVWNSYDSHIPLLFMGWGIKQGESSQPYFMTDIAPTLAALLHIEFPSGNVGNPIVEVIKQ